MYIVITLIIVAIVVIITSLWAYFMAFYNDEKFSDMRKLPSNEQYKPYHPILKKLMDEMDSLNGESVYISIGKGKKLYATYYHCSDDAPIHIQFHGYKGNYLRDFCGGNKLARDMGHNTLVIQERAHTQSFGRTISFGIKERYDCLSWIKYVNERFGDKTPIILSGVSMGAATVLMASDMDLPQNVVGIIADCPYSSPKEIIKQVAEKRKYPASLVMPFIWLGGIIWGHFNLFESDPIRAVKNSKCPILLIHGEDDRFVPCCMSKKIYENSDKSKTTLITFPGAAHGMSYIVDTERYTKESEKFFSSILNQAQIK
jgi:fermentation-respiration switch protein FrsA (DUF1100 family)